jgi:hypothetical protein
MMEVSKRSGLLSSIYKVAKSVGKKVYPDAQESYGLLFPLCSISLRRKNTGINVTLSTPIFRPGYSHSQDEPYRMFIYKGNRDGLKEIGFEDFEITSEGEPGTPQYRLLLSRKSRDKDYKITEDDKAFFDVLLSYCAGRCQRVTDYDHTT